MDYLTWLLISNDEAWTEEAAEDASPARPQVRSPGTAAGASAEAALNGGEAEPIRARLRRGIRAASAPEEIEALPASVRQRAARARDLRRRAEQAAPSATEPRRTRSDGNPSVLWAAADYPSAAVSPPGETSMDDISRFFERDARRYG